MKNSANTIKEITLMVSGYSEGNSELKEIKKAADLKFERGFFAEGYQAYADMRKPWIDDLEKMFSSISVPMNCVGLTGLYDGVLEPSLMWTLEFEGDEHWKTHAPAIKTVLVDFGEKYHQKNVHLVDLHAKRTASTAYGQLVGDVTFQKKLWIHLDAVSYAFGDQNTNYLRLREIVRKTGISNLTFHSHGVAVLVYSIGSEGIPQFDQDSKKLIAALENQEMICHLVQGEDVALINYGMYGPDGAGYGQSHSYDEARRLIILSQ